MELGHTDWSGCIEHEYGQMELFEDVCPFCGVFDWFGGETDEYTCGEYPCIPLKDSLMKWAELGEYITVYMGGK